MEEGAFNDCCFSMLHTCLSDDDMRLDDIAKKVFIDHLSNIKIHFEHYFRENTQQQNWITDSFSADLSTKLKIH